MKIYIASHSRELALEIEQQIKHNTNHKIVSRWIYCPFNPTNSYSLSDRQRIAEEDVNDVKSCDLLVLQSGEEKYPGGKFVELGIALGLNKKVYVIGREENMLIYYKDITICSTINDFITKVK